MYYKNETINFKEKEHYSHLQYSVSKMHIKFSSSIKKTNINVTKKNFKEEAYQNFVLQPTLTNV